jgi:ABC-type sugar transport system permease subunit
MNDNVQKIGGIHLPQKKKMSLHTSGCIFSFFMLIPVLFNFFVFYLGVNLGSIALAFSTPTPEGGEVFSLINFENFIKELGRTDSAVYMALFNTLEYYLMGLIKFALTSVIAYFFYKKVYLHKIYKVVFFLPSMVPGMVYISIFKNFITTYGPVYVLVESIFGIKMPPIMAYPETAKWAIMFYAFWSGFGAQLLIQIGSMNRIPEEVIEAATLDGCLGFKEFWYIVLPLIFETIATYFLLGIIGIFQASGPFLFFVGESMPQVHTLSYWIFTQALGGKTNYPAAIGLIFTIAALPLVLISRWGLNKVETVTY